tara:strand:- start:358 stop:1554 length:1197 start_codon:yes stop_codon:yes gene_type:complete
MTYYPKQSIFFRQSAVGEFLFKTNKSPYEGPIMETSTGKYYAGEDYMDMGSELIKATTLDMGSLGFGYSSDVHIYNSNLKVPIFAKRKLYKSPTPTKIQPTEEDYERGYYTRYYMVKTNNDAHVFEVSEKTYDNLTGPKPKEKYDENLYKAGAFLWALKGNVSSINFLTLEEEALMTPQINIAFPLLTEFFKPPKPKKSDSYKYDIQGRFYPDDDINEIPNNLPPTYNKGNYDINCSNCIFFHASKNHCKKWNANVRGAYKCKSWQIVQRRVDASYEEYLKEINEEKEENLRAKREGKTPTELGKALAEALQIRGEDVEEIEEGILYEEQSKSQPPSKSFYKRKTHSRKGKKPNITKEVNTNSKHTLLNGTYVGEIILNQFDKKYYKWSGIEWMSVNV